MLLEDFINVSYVFIETLLESRGVIYLSKKILTAQKKSQTQQISSNLLFCTYFNISLFPRKDQCSSQRCPPQNVKTCSNIHKHIQLAFKLFRNKWQVVFKYQILYEKWIVANSQSHSFVYFLYWQFRRSKLNCLRFQILLDLLQKYFRTYFDSTSIILKSMQSLLIQKNIIEFATKMIF